MKRPILVITVLCCSMICATSGSVESEVDGTCESCSADPRCIDAVRKIFEICQLNVMYISVALAPLKVLGDRATAGLLNLHDVKTLASTENTEAYLRFVRIAFSAPTLIERAEDRTPMVSILLLDDLKLRHTDNSKLTSEIDATTIYIEKQTSQSPTK